MKSLIFIFKIKHQKSNNWHESIGSMGGGSQTNRGYKYIFENKLNTQTSKLLCIVCKDANIKLNKGKIRESKKLKILDEGFKNDTLCYLGNLKNIIYKFFDMAV